MIDHENTNHGEISTQDALQKAKDAGLDLVIVSPGKDIPVAKILDYGKQEYQRKKRQNQTSQPTLKEVKLRPNVGESDYVIRIDRAIKWLEKGNSVKFQVRLRGREHQHRDRATELLERVVEDLKQVAEVQAFNRRALVLQVAPA